MNGHGVEKGDVVGDGGKPETNVMLGIADVTLLGKGLGVPVALVMMVLPAGSINVKLGHTGVVYNVTPVVMVAGRLDVAVLPPPPLPPPTTIVEIQMTDTVRGGRVTVVVNPELVTVTSG